MKTYLTVLLCVASSLLSFGQVPAYFHDSTLDGINANVGQTHYDLGIIKQSLDMLNTNLINKKSIDTNDIQQQGGALVVSYNTYTSTNANPFASTNASTFSNSFSALIGGGGFTNPFTGSASNIPVSTVSSIALDVFNPYLGTVQHTFSVDFSMNVFTTTHKTMLSTVRKIIVGFIYLSLFLFSLQYIQEQISKAMQQRQVGGLNQEALTFNTEGPTALIYAQLIVALFVSMLAFIVTNGFIKTAFSQTNSLFPSIAALSTWPGWDVANAFCPFPEAVGALTAYLGFRYLLMWPLFFFARSIILFLLR